jgi:hypothetical protein
MKSVLLILILCCASFRGVSQLSESTIKQVSLIQLIANPDKYDGRRVNVIGYLRLEAEGNILYLDIDDWRNAVSENGIWIDVNGDINANRAHLDRKYVQLLGTFSTRKSGNEVGAGSLIHIQSATFWSDPEHPRAERSGPARNE